MRDLAQTFRTALAMAEQEREFLKDEQFAELEQAARERDALVTDALAQLPPEGPTAEEADLLHRLHHIQCEPPPPPPARRWTAN